MESPFPPFEPHSPDNGREKQRNRQISWRHVTPNLVTLIALCAGLTSIRMTLEGRYFLAIAAIGLAIILDGLDGRIARFLKASSKFGAELDSLADFVNFGVAPAVLVYVVWLEPLKAFGWLAALLYAICTALRLARFNSEMEKPETAAWKKAFAVGVPAPAGALTVLLPAYFHQAGLQTGTNGAVIVLAYTLFIAFLMVSRLPTFSGKQVNAVISREVVIPIFILTVMLVALLFSYPWEGLSVITIAYLAALPVSWRAYQKHKNSRKNT